MSDLGVNGVSRTNSTGSISGENINATLISRHRGSQIMESQVEEKKENPLLKQTSEKLDGDNQSIQSGTLNKSKVSNQILEIFEGEDINIEPKVKTREERSNAIVDKPEIEKRDQNTIIKDQQTLTKTNDDYRPISEHEYTVSKRVTENLAPIVKKLDSTIMTSNKEKVFQEAFQIGKSMIENAHPQSDLVWALTLNDPKEIKEQIAKGIVETKPKYREEFNKLNTEYNNKLKSYDRLKQLVSEYGESKDPQVKSRIKNEFITECNKYFPEHNPLTDSGNLRGIGSKPKRPTAYDLLANSKNGNKQRLVNEVFNGITSVELPNKVTQFESKVIQKEVEGKTITYNVDIPNKIIFNGKEYENKKLLGIGGEGAAFLMEWKDPQNQNNISRIVLKAPAIIEGNMMGIDEINQNMKVELNTHKHAMGPMGNGNKNMLKLEGAINFNGNLLPITELAPGGEMTDFVSKIDSNTNISDKTKELLKISLMKDSISGMQYVHTGRGMMHHDIKPSNFFIGSDGQALVSDFGRAKTNHSIVDYASTAAYAPPEASGQWDKLTDEKGDIFSLGVSFNEIMTGKNYFETNNPLDTYKDNPNFKLGSTSNTGINEIINAMTSENKSQRPNLTAILEHSVFTDPILNSPELLSLKKELVSPNPDQEKIKELTKKLDLM